MNPSESKPLTLKQYLVLKAVDGAYREEYLPVNEYGVYRYGSRASLWEPGGVLFGHLRKLTDRGMVERTGKRGAYCYEVSALGREVLTERRHLPAGMRA